MQPARKLPFTRFSTTQYGSGACWDAWRDSISVLFDVAPLADTIHAQTEQSVQGTHLGSVLFGEIKFVAQSFARSRAKIIRDGLEHYLVQLYLAGGYAGAAGEADIELRAGDIGFLDLAQPLQTSNPHSHAYNLVIPRNLLDAAIADAGRLHGVILRRETAAGQLLGEHLRMMAKTLPDTLASDTPMLVEATIGMVAACFRPCAATRDKAGTALEAARLGAVKRYIEAHLHAPALSPAGIAAALRLSRTSMYRLFAPLGGVSAYVQARRLARARAALSQPNVPQRSIHEIAFACGFTSEAHFSRSFRERYGMPPSLLQKQAQDGLCPGLPGAGDEDYARWITRLATAM